MFEPIIAPDTAILTKQVQQLQDSLNEAQETLRAIRNGEIDALLGEGDTGEQIYILQGADSLHRLFLEEMVQGAVTLTSQGFILYCNRRFCESLDLTQEQIIGHSFTKFVNPVEQRAFEELLNSSMRANSQGELKLCNPEGKLIPVELSLNPLLVEDSLLICVVVTDLTERKQVESFLQRSAATNRALLDAIPDVMLRISREGILLNFKAEKEFGLPLLLQNALGLSIPAIFSEDKHLAELFMSQVSETLATGQTQFFEYQLELNAQVSEYEARGVISGPEEVMVLIRDITERKKVERLKNEFVSTVSHELRTPLTSIRGSLGLVLGGISGEISSQTRTMIEIAYKNTERLVRLINDILDIEKIESGKLVFEMRPLDIVSLVEQTLEANQAYGQEYGVSIELVQFEEGLKVRGDNDRLTQVLTNLISNAVKFSPQGGTVKIGVERYKTGLLRVSIKDDGPGIPLEFQNRIFQKFAQADNSNTRQKGGTGLGLSIARAIVESHGGELDFETDIGIGTSFYFDLPLWEGLLPLLDATMDTGQSRILICEDDADIAKILSIMLQKAGYIADVAYDTVQARQMLMERTYDAMTLDMVLPGEDGLTLLKELREQPNFTNLAVIIISGKDSERWQELQAKSLGVVGWLDKPIDRAGLLRAVKQAVAINKQSNNNQV